MSQVGFQPRNTPAERRAFFDQQRRITDLAGQLEAIGGDLEGLDARFVNIDGDTMTGELLLPANPTSALGAAPKQYVDFCVKKGGDTMSGHLTLNADPVNVLHAATKQYVDRRVAFRWSRAAMSIGTGDQTHTAALTIIENIGGWAGTAVAAAPLIIPEAGTYALAAYYSGGNFTRPSASADSGAIFDAPGASYYIPFLAGTTNRVGGPVIVTLAAADALTYRIRNQTGAAVANVVMYAEAVKIA